MFAGAAFTDQADIAVDSDVVDTLVALGVIEGYTDGSFRPDDTVTRAEMAKMIYTVRTGRSDASAYNDDVTTFTDIGDHWARGYIKYCNSMGIIAGHSTTRFAPDDTVTTQQAAKMLLVTLGYDAERAGLTGAGWGTKTNALADENGLLDNVNNGTTQGLPRQYAAQLIYNAINASTVVYRDGAYTNTNYQDQPNQTIGQKYMGLYISVGTLNGVVKESGKDTYKMTLTMSSDNKKDSDQFEGAYQDTFTNVAKDYSALKNQVVKVLFKDTDEVYGVFATEDTSVLSGVVGDFEIDSSSKVKFDGSKYSIADDTKKVTIDGADGSETISAYIKGQAAEEKAADAKIVLNSDDKVDTMDVTSYMVGQVSYVGSDYVNVVYKDGFAANNFSGYSKLDSDSCNSDISDLKKDDYVIITNSAVNDKLDAVKADTVTGSISSTRDSGNEVRIDGTWYKSALASNDKIALSNDVTVVLKDNYIVFVDDVKVGSTDVALMIEVAKNSGVGAKWQADVLFTDGSRKVVDVDDEKSNILTTSGSNTTVAVQGPVLVTYEQSGSKYELNTIATSGDNKYAGYDAQIANMKATGWYVKDGRVLKGDNTFASYINESAAIFLQYGSDDYKVVTGADMKNWGESYKFGADLLANNSNGYPYAEVGFVKSTDLKSPTGSDKTYAYIFNVEEAAKDENNNNYVLYNVFDGSEMTTLKVKQAASNAYAEGTVVEFTLDSDGYANCDSVYGKTQLAAGFLTSFAWDGKGNDGDVKIGTAGTDVQDYKIDKDDTMVLFIDTNDQSGVAESILQEAIAQYNDSGVVTGYTKNVAFYDANGDKTLDVLVVDVTNEIDTALFD